MSPAPVTPATLPIPTDPALRPLLNVVYAAWADGELTTRDIIAVREQISTSPAATPEVQEFLAAWLRPEFPPSAEQMQDLLRAAAKATDSEQGPPEPPAEELRNLLHGIETSLGIGMHEATADEAGTSGLDADVPGERSRIDVQALSALLDGRHAAFREQVRAILSRSEFALRHGLPVDAYRQQVFEWCKLLAGEGLGRSAYPESCGGEEDQEKALVAFETLAFHDTSLLIKYGVQFGLFGGSINMLGTSRHHETFLKRVATLELPGCFAMTEQGHGSNVAGIETTATYDRPSDTFVIRTPCESARKQYIGNAACHARIATVFAQLHVDESSHGVHAFLVPIRDEEGHPLPGVRIEDTGLKMGLNGVDNGRLSFEDVRVPRSNLLNRYADLDSKGVYTTSIPSPSKRFFTTLGALVAGRISIAAGALSGAKTGLAIAVRYGARRRQFGPPSGPETRILDYRTHQRRLFPAIATCYALDFALKSLGRRFATAGDAEEREVEALAAGLKAYSTWRALETLQACRECCGGAGYLTVNRIASLRTDMDIFATFEGDNTVLLQLLAKGLLTDYRRQFEDMRAFTIVRHLAARAEIAVSELNPVVTRMTSRDHLRDPKFQASAFAYREEHLLASAARRLRHRIGQGMDSHDAFHECQDHLLALAWAHVERGIVERFGEGIESCDESLRPVLRRLCDLYSLSRLEADRAWYLESGYFSGAKAKAIRGQVNDLCADLRPDAVALVDSFGIPEGLLAGTIGDCRRPDGPARSRSR